MNEELKNMIPMWMRSDDEVRRIMINKIEEERENKEREESIEKFKPGIRIDEVDFWRMKMLTRKF